MSKAPRLGSARTIQGKRFERVLGDAAQAMPINYESELISVSASKGKFAKHRNEFGQPVIRSRAERDEFLARSGMEWNGPR